MKINKQAAYALVLAVGTVVAVAGCKKKEDAAVPATETAATTAPAPMSEAPAAAPTTAPVTVSSVSVGNTAAADRSVAPVALLKPSDKIIVSVRTDGAASNAEIGAKLTYQDGQVAGEQSASLNTGGAEVTNIEFTNANAWPAGKYRAEVTVNGQPAGTAQEFEVR